MQQMLQPTAVFGAHFHQSFDDLFDKLYQNELFEMLLVTDFDHTLTTMTSRQCHDIITLHEALSQEFREEINCFWQTAIAPPEGMSYADWWRVTHAMIAKKSGFTFEMLDMAVKTSDASSMYLREGVKELFSFCKDARVPTIIASAGFVNIIERTLEVHGISVEQTHHFHIDANKLEFDEKSGALLRIIPEEPLTGRVKCQLPFRVPHIFHGLKAGSVEPRKQCIIAVILGDRETDFDVLREHEDFEVVRLCIGFAATQQRANELVEGNHCDVVLLGEMHSVFPVVDLLKYLKSILLQDRKEKAVSLDAKNRQKAIAAIFGDFPKDCIHPLPALRSSQFVVMQYNILAAALASSCIPWITELEPITNDVFLTATGENFQTWMRREGLREYLAHFHRNSGGGCQNTMRSLWSSAIDKQEDIPKNLTNITFVQQDTFQYFQSSDQQLQLATTLRGLLRSFCPSIADEIYQGIMQTEKYRTWTTRGPAIFRRIISNAIVDQKAPAGYFGADIVTLAEYDVHELVADYRGCEIEETFPDAMQSAGFDGICMARPGYCGKAIYWNREKFELASSPESAPSRVFYFYLHSDLDGVRDVNMEEHFYSTTDDDDKRVPLPEAEKRPLGLVELRHRASGRVVLVAYAHMMTDSRDNKSCNKYPGQVRAEELASCRRLVEETVAAKPHIDSVIFTGDFNCNLVSESDGVGINEVFILKGRVKSSDGSKELVIPTGWREKEVEEPGDIEAVSSGSGGESGSGHTGSSGSGTSGSGGSVAAAEAGSDAVDDGTGSDGSPVSVSTPEPTFEWAAGTLSLREVFAPVHKWGRAVGPGPTRVCSSYNSKRCSWIDFLWYSQHSLKVVSRSDCGSPESPIPNADHPSDHLPIAALFELV